MLTSFDNIWQAVQDEVKDSNLDKLTFIRSLNRFLQRMNLTKPAEQQTKIYYITGWEKYSIPIGFREPIGMYSEIVPAIYYVSNYRFNLGDPNQAFTDVVNSSIRYLRVRDMFSNSQASYISGCDSLTDNGIWSITGGINLTPDVFTKKDGAASLSFNINTTQCILNFTRSTPLNATAYTEFMRERLFADMGVRPTNIKLRAGNDSNNYFEHVITRQSSNELFSLSEWNELEFAQESAVQTGNVDKSNMIWFEIEFNFSVAPNSIFRVDKLQLCKPEVLNFEWYTNYVAIDANGDLIESLTESVSLTDDVIIKDYPDFINVVVDGLCYEYLKVPDPERAANFHSRYINEYDTTNKKTVGGLAYLAARYPMRRMNYKRIKTLPDLNYNVAKTNRNIYVSDN